MEGKAGECLMANGTQDKVRELQNKLYRAAKLSPTRRFHALYDKLCRQDFLWRAWVDVASNGGALGVDGVTIAHIGQNFIVIGDTVRVRSRSRRRDGVKASCAPSSPTTTARWRQSRYSVRSGRCFGLVGAVDAGKGSNEADELLRHRSSEHPAPHLPGHRQVR